MSNNSPQCGHPLVKENFGTFQIIYSLNKTCTMLRAPHSLPRISSDGHLALPHYVRLALIYILRSKWWRQRGSNPRPEACKATALPTELCPRIKSLCDTSHSVLVSSRTPRATTWSCLAYARNAVFKEMSQADQQTHDKTPVVASDWWAWEDLNFRPHAYQARALTN